MHSGGFSFVPSTSSSGTVPFQGSHGFLSPPRFISRLREFPLDLRYRPVLTPPTTPSPPRKRSRLLNLDLKAFEAENSQANSVKNFSQANQFSSTISIDDKKYFQNSVESFWPKIASESKIGENSNEFIDITSSDNETEKLQSARIVESEFAQSDSNLTEDLSNHDAHSETSDEIVDIESNDDSVVFSELLSIDEKKTVLETGKMFFEDPQLHTKAIEGFAKLFDASLYTVSSDVPRRSSVNHRSKNERKRVKSRKQLVDEETTSPVSGTIIRKLNDGEELIVRKGDIDPVSAEI